MNIQEYNQLFPHVRVMQRVTLQKDRTTAIVQDGMLLFTEQSAFCWAGPYEGNYAYFAIIDERNIPNCPLLTEAQERQRYRFARYAMPWNGKRQYGDDAQSEKHLQARLKLLNNKQLKEWENNQQNHVIDQTTIENPISFYMAGNDDCSYTKFFPNIEAAQEQLLDFITSEPLNFDTVIHQNGFVFTN